MQILLACAKTMRERAARPVDMVSRPLFEQEAQHIALEMVARSVDELCEMFHCSSKIAVECMQRYQRFTDPSATLPAIFGYNGQAYRSLDALSLSDDDLHHAQHHLWITSFLYGLLRPLDQVHPYRMEGNVRLETTAAAMQVKATRKMEPTLFEYWRPRLTDVLIDSVLADDGVLVHLATAEMERLFDWKRVMESVHVVQPRFLMERRGRLTAVSVYAKSCRGAMTRYILRNRLTDPHDLLSFSHEGFEYSAADSMDDQPTFIV